MPKYTVDDVKQITADNLSRIRSNADEWADFLIRSAYFYKYSFEEQIVITSLKANATAVADFNVWSKKLNAHINRGAKGIPLIQNREGHQSIIYVYDISDTNSTYKLWQMPDVDKFSESLAKTFSYTRKNTDIDSIISAQTLKRSNGLFEKIISEKNDIRQSGLDDFIFYSIYVLTMQHCGLNPEYHSRYFEYLNDNSLTDEQFLYIGNLINEQVRQILISIEKTSRAFYRAEKNAAQIEQNNVTTSEPEVRRETSVSPENHIIGNTPYKFIAKKHIANLQRSLR